MMRITKSQLDCELKYAIVCRLKNTDKIVMIEISSTPDKFIYCDIDTNTRQSTEYTKSLFIIHTNNVYAFFIIVTLYAAFR